MPNDEGGGNVIGTEDNVHQVVDDRNDDDDVQGQSGSSSSSSSGGSINNDGDDDDDDDRHANTAPQVRHVNADWTHGGLTSGCYATTKFQRRLFICAITISLLQIVFFSYTLWFIAGN